MLSAAHQHLGHDQFPSVLSGALGSVFFYASLGSWGALYRRINSTSPVGFSGLQLVSELLVDPITLT